MKLGREVVFDYLRDVGVNYLFGVPGTHEIPTVDGTAAPGNNVQYVPCLHENIALDHRARTAAGRPVRQQRGR